MPNFNYMYNLKYQEEAYKKQIKKIEQLIFSLELKKQRRIHFLLKTQERIEERRQINLIRRKHKGVKIC